MKRAAVLITILLAMVATGCASAPTRATDTAFTQHAALYNCNGTHTCYPQTSTFDLWR
jgi:hypothetical protein